MTVVSGDVGFMRIFTGVPWEWASNDSGVLENGFDELPCTIPYVFVECKNGLCTRPPCPGRVGSWDSRRSEVFFRGGEWKTNSATNLRINKKAQLSLTNPRDACEKFARFT